MSNKTSVTYLNVITQQTNVIQYSTVQSPQQFSEEKSVKTQPELYCIVQCFTSPPTQYRLYGRQFLQVKRPNQQYQSTRKSTKDKPNNGNNTKRTCI